MILAGSTACYLALAGALLSATTEPEPYAGAVEVRRFSFEADEDRDFDDRPDDWSRRKGDGFPAYVGVEIDRTRGGQGDRSLRFDVNGGQAAIYSPVIPIDPWHSYIVRGRIRTQILEHDAAMISVSFLNHERQRVSRTVSRTVTGTHDGWVDLQLGPLAPGSDVRFIVLGCHLLQGRRMDIRGAVWFDDLWIGRLPQLEIEGGAESHFVAPSEPLRVVARASGVDAEHEFRLHLQLEQEDGRVLASKLFDLKPEVETIPAEDGSPFRRPIGTEWSLPSQGYGYYRVRANLLRDGAAILEKETAFAVIDFVDANRRSGEFGWSVEGETGRLAPREMARIAEQAGINWLKYPLWGTVRADAPRAATETAELLDLLTHRSVRTVGMLDEPPPAMRAKFARNWTGISEVFNLPPEFWLPSLGPVLARYSSNVDYWQLGGDSDFSFVGLERLPETLGKVKREFDRIGRDTRVGVHWNWNAPLPSKSDFGKTFFALSDRTPLTDAELAAHLERTKSVGTPRWAVLRSLPRESVSSAARAADLVRRMVAAKVGGAEAIFAADLFHEQYGLLRSNGTPTSLFLPWRNTALALQGAKYLGSLELPHGSKNHVFSRDGEMILVLWRDEAEVDYAEASEERIYLGEQVVVTDVRGSRTPAEREPETGRQIVPADSMPRIVRGCSEPIARWRLRTRFLSGQAGSSTGEHEEAILGFNPFPQGVSGEVRLNVPDGWEAKPDRWTIEVAAGEEFRLPLYLTLPPNATLGEEPCSIDFEIVADRSYRFRVHRPYRVGLGDIDIRVVERVLEDGRLEIEQIISNRTRPLEVLDLRCSLFVPGRKRQTIIVTRLGDGQDKKLFTLPSAASLEGQELWLRAEQIAGNRVLNYKWHVGQNRE